MVVKGWRMSVWLNPETLLDGYADVLHVVNRDGKENVMTLANTTECADSADTVAIWF